MNELTEELNQQVQNYELKFDSGASGMLVIQHAEHGVVNFVFNVDGNGVFHVEQGTDHLGLLDDFLNAHPAAHVESVVAE